MKLLRKYLATIAGAIAVVTTVIVAGLIFAQSSIGELVSVSVEDRGQSFSNYLLDSDRSLDALLTGMTRDPDTEAQVRSVASASGIANFSVFDDTGKEVYSFRSDRYAWLLRERPGGTVTGDKLSSAYVDRTGPWIAVENAEADSPSAILPLDRDGRRIGYISVSSDMADRRATYTRILTASVAILLLILILATGIPALIYMRRKWRIEQADERIQFLANYDTLTHLPNRKRMQEEADRILATSRATRERMALWYLDLEGLADINNSMGHPVGDELLRTIAARLTAAVERNDPISRLGADDFVVLQRRMSASSDLEAFAKRLLQALEVEVVIDGHRITPRLCLGVATVPEHGRTYLDLVRHAELALLTHKSTKQGDYALFDISMDEDAHRRRRIEGLMRKALAQDGFELFYQPIVSGCQGTPLGFEALIRLPDGEGGYVYPSDFIPIAEARGSIKAIGDWVIREATRQIALWPEHLFISVNLSAVQFRDGDIVDIVRSALEASGIAGHRLEIEVVESLLLDRSDAVLEQLRGLKALGVSIAMDDFGTGYSSLGYLWRFPFDKLKIDQSFMLAFEQGEANVSQILETIVSLGHHMKMKVTTEGVETAQQAAVLASLGCDQLQGYYFGRPMPADRVAAEMLHLTTQRASQVFGTEPELKRDAVA